MAKYTAYEIQAKGGDFIKVERELQEPPPGHVRVKVQACGLCHSDCFTKEGFYPGVSFPRSPGHEVAGDVDAVGAGVTKWKAGDRVGVGWYGGQCTECEACREGDLVLCEKSPVTGIHYDGGYGRYIVANATALAALPEELSYAEAAPLLCAGVTVYNGLRHTKALPGALVGVQGLGGLGHLAIQFANKMGFRVVAFSRGEDKKEKALALGAHHYIDTNKEDFLDQVKTLGSLKVIIATSTSPKAMSQVLPALGRNGTFLVLGAGMEPMEVSALFLLGGRRSVAGHPSGAASDSEDCLKFAVLSGVRSMNEVYPASKAAEAYERMMSGAHFRVVIDWSQE
eukprot:TRINITY_DN39092_c0_g1_i1.p1 TRINITY_DN39092_c0_g1~~TRINITY_DN39092_c0_g1_i1.p1  ORF type:complete len:340 (-),score=57.44 TRINITY_DN39092_c0_g1_i1:395-1414(-)